MTERESKPRYRWLISLAKVCVTVALCWIIAVNVDWASTWQQFRSVGWIVVSVLFFIMVANVVISAAKWRLILRIHHIDYPLAQLTKYYFVAMFLNNFLPTSIGGDGYRVFKTWDNGNRRSSAVVAVLTERITGFGALVLLGLVACLALLDSIPAEITGTMAIIGLLCLGAPIGLWVLSARLPPKLKRARDILAQHLNDYVAQPRRLFGVIAVSVGFHLLLTSGYYLVLSTTGAESVGLPALLVVLSISSLVAVLPVSINGIGVFEGTFMYLLGLYGVPYEASVIPMILNRVLLVPISLAGAVVYLTNKPAPILSPELEN